MDQLLLAAQPDSSPWETLVIVLAFAACAAVWIGIFARKFHGLPVLPYQPRRQVPWNGLDVLVVFVIAYPVSLIHILFRLFGVKLPGPPPVPDDANLDTTHPIARLLLDGGSVWWIVLAVLAALLVAPLLEEFFFRVVLQGWLEAVETRGRRQARHMRMLMRGSLAVGLSSLTFAAMHFRRAAAAVPIEEIAISTAIFVAYSLLAVGVGMWFLWMRGATWADLGIVPRKWLADIKFGLLTFLAVTPPVLLLNVFCCKVFPNNVVLDPVPLFFLAIALGVLCYRTRRIGPAIVLHAAFNGVNVLIALEASK